MFLTEAIFARPAFRLRTTMRSTMRIITIALLTTFATLAPAQAQDVRFHDARGRVTGSARTDANGVTTFHDRAGRGPEPPAPAKIARETRA